MARGSEKEKKKEKVVTGINTGKSETSQRTTMETGFVSNVQEPLQTIEEDSDQVLGNLQANPLYGKPVNLENADIADAPHIPAEQQRANGFGAKVRRLKDKITRPFRSHKNQPAVVSPVTQGNEEEKIEDREHLREQQKTEELARLKEQQKTEELARLKEQQETEEHLREEEEKRKKEIEEKKQEEEHQKEKAFREEVDETVALIDRKLYGADAGTISGPKTKRVYRGRELDWDGTPDETYAAHVTKLMDSFHDALYPEIEDGDYEMSPTDAFVQYSEGSNYINYLLRNGELEEDDDNPEQIYNATKSMVKFLNTTTAPEDIFAVRHISLEGLGLFVGKTFKTPENSLTVDSVFEELESRVNYQDLVGRDKALISATTIPQGSSGFNDGLVEMRIMIPQGTHGCYIKECSGFSEEDEFMLQAGTSFRVLKMEKKDTGHGPSDTNPKIVVYVKAMPNLFDMNNFPKYTG